MSRLAWAFAATALIATTTSVHLWSELRAERFRTGSLQHRVDQLELARMAPSSSFALAPHTPVNPQSAATVVPAAGAQFALNTQELMKDPDDREGLTMSLRQSLRASLAHNYPNLAGDLGLTQEQAGKTLDIVARYQIASMSPTQSASADEGARRQIAWQESQREQEAEIIALIGDSKYQEWREYQSSMSARQRASRLVMALESVGQPLTEPQHRQLVETMVAVQKRQSEDPRLNVLPSSAATLQDQLTYIEQALQDTNRRVLDSASSYLSQAQIESLRKVQDQELSLTRSMRAQRNQVEAGG